MYSTYPPAVHYGSYVRQGLPLSPSPLRMSAVGAIIGGTAAAAANIRRVQRNDISPEEAIRRTLKTGVNSALATAAATAVAGMLGRNRLWLSLAAMAATGATVMYLLEE